MDILTQPVSIAGIPHVDVLMFCHTVRLRIAECHDHAPRRSCLPQVPLEK